MCGSVGASVSHYMTLTRTSVRRATTHELPCLLTSAPSTPVHVAIVCHIPLCIPDRRLTAGLYNTRSASDKPDIDMHIPSARGPKTFMPTLGRGTVSRRRCVPDDRSSTSV